MENEMIFNTITSVPEYYYVHFQRPKFKCYKSCTNKSYIKVIYHLHQFSFYLNHFKIKN